MRHLAVSLLAALTLLGACATQVESVDESSRRLDAARNIVDAVNAKDSELYIRDLAQDVVVAMYDGEVRLRGRDAVRQNRENHFRAHPEARNELVHLVEIDDRVVMHDLVWLTPGRSRPADIVEVFTFEGHEIVRIDVIQPEDLFTR